MACCEECAQAQSQGLMDPGTTCSPCASERCPPTNVSPHLKRACAPGYQLVHTPSSGYRCIPKRPISACECPTFMLQRVDALATGQWEQSNGDVEGITLMVLEAVYSQTPDGRPIDWRNLTNETATCLLELRRRVHARVAYVLAHHDEEAAEKRWETVRGGQ